MQFVSAFLTVRRALFLGQSFALYKYFIIIIITIISSVSAEDTRTCSARLSVISVMGLCSLKTRLMAQY